MIISFSIFFNIIKLGMLDKVRRIMHSSTESITIYRFFSLCPTPKPYSGAIVNATYKNTSATVAIKKETR